MRLLFSVSCVWLFLVCLLASVPVPAAACTGMRVIAKDGTVAFARSMEFGLDTKSSLMVTPRSLSWTGITPKGETGLHWKNAYAFMGPDIFGDALPAEGINEKGLYVGAFFFQEPSANVHTEPADYPKVVSLLQIPAWLLGTCATVDEVRHAIKTIALSETFVKSIDMIPHGHWIVIDNQGKSIVLEITDSKLHAYDNPVGVLTNAPEFPWQLTNLRNYVNLHAINAAPQKLGDLTVVPAGQGSGMLGLPGDYTPPSRFVRAVFLSNFAKPVTNDGEAVILAWNLINNFSIPVGVSGEQDATGKTAYDYTQWQTVYDLTRHLIYFRTYDNQNIRTVSLDKFLNGKKSLFIPMVGVKATYQDVSGEAK